MQVVGQGLPDRPRLPERRVFSRATPAGSTALRQAYFGPQLGWLTTAVLERGDLATPRQGPCIIEEYDATCVVPPRAKVRLDAYGDLIIDLL
jgi:N-methylhydantoinase A